VCLDTSSDTSVRNQKIEPEVELGNLAFAIGSPLISERIVRKVSRPPSPDKSELVSVIKAKNKQIDQLNDKLQAFQYLYQI